MEQKKSWAREEAFLALNKIIRESSFSNLELKDRLNNANLGRLDRALVTEIVNGVLRNLLKIDYIIGKFLNRPKGKKLDGKVEDILRCGVYQIIFLDKIPDSAVCNECVELSKKYSNDGAAKLINGVLRNVSRGKETIVYPDRNEDIIQYLSIEYSFAEWLIKKWIADFGIEFTEELLKSSNQIPELCVRVNTLKISREALIVALEEEQLEVTRGTRAAEALYIKKAAGIEHSKLYKQGLFQIQDESSMLVAHVVNPNPGDLIIDVCSAPGGKVTHMAQLMGDKGQLIARDIHPHKLELIKNSCNRLGITSVEADVFDAAVKDGNYFDKADKVLVDAPCSGLGIIRRKQDIKLNMIEVNLRSLAELQKKILRNASCYVKLGGELVYSTCTINKDENEKQVETFLESNPNFELMPITHIEGVDGSKGYFQMYPNLHHTDGFFIAKFKKTRG